ncbi:transposase [Nocardia asteroides]|uniref:transposase n=1 Tax=Nocardia asteroides TaxID=1824 RepID=UPI0037B4D473
MEHRRHLTEDPRSGDSAGRLDRARPAYTVPPTPGQIGDNPQLLPLLDGIRVARSGPGRRRMRPEVVIADKAYSHPSTHQELRRRRVRLVGREPTDQIARRAAQGSRGGRPSSFDGRAMLQPARAIPGSGHPLRQARRLLLSELTITAIILWL